MLHWHNNETSERINIVHPSCTYQSGLTYRRLFIRIISSTRKTYQQYKICQSRGKLKPSILYLHLCGKLSFVQYNIICLKIRHLDAYMPNFWILIYFSRMDSFKYLLPMICILMTIMLTQTTAAPSSGRCTYTAEDWEDIIYTMCGRRTKRSTGGSLVNAVQGTFSLHAINQLENYCTWSGGANIKSNNLLSSKMPSIM